MFFLLPVPLHFGIHSLLRSCAVWNTSIISLPSSGHICLPMDMTTIAAALFMSTVSYSGTICACVTDYCNSLEMVFGTALDLTTQASIDITTQGFADITAQGSANITTQGYANVTTRPSPGTTKGAEGGADHAVMSLYLLCVIGLALFY